MNHVTGQDRRIDINPQNNINDVEEMETQEGRAMRFYAHIFNLVDTLAK